jgi:hypothetical protein
MQKTMVLLTDEQSIYLDHRITKMVVKMFQKYNFTRTHPNEFYDCKQYIWMRCLQALNKYWKRDAGPTTFVEPMLSNWAYDFFFTQHWLPRANRTRPLPRFINLERVIIRLPAFGARKKTRLKNL